jgi:nicotinamide mononucleotide transporter
VINNSLLTISSLELAGVFFGLIAVWLLIKQNIWTWPFGIFYIAISLYIFYASKLYADFALHIFYLFMHLYGWVYWLKTDTEKNLKASISRESQKMLLFLLVLSLIGIFVSGYLLVRFSDADLAYWDSTTSILSLSAMWLQSRKRIECWGLWLFVDIIAAGVYFYKGIFFYSLLYTIYIGMAVLGFKTWQKSYLHEHTNHSRHRS